MKTFMDRLLVAAIIVLYMVLVVVLVPNGITPLVLAGSLVGVLASFNILYQIRKKR